MTDPRSPLSYGNEIEAQEHQIRKRSDECDK